MYKTRMKMSRMEMENEMERMMEKMEMSRRNVFSEELFLSFSEEWSSVAEGMGKFFSGVWGGWMGRWCEMGREMRKSKMVGEHLQLPERMRMRVRMEMVIGVKRRRGVIGTQPHTPRWRHVQR
jgi:hypothetical protein